MKECPKCGAIFPDTALLCKTCWVQLIPSHRPANAQLATRAIDNAQKEQVAKNKLELQKVKDSISVKDLNEALGKISTIKNNIASNFTKIGYRPDIPEVQSSSASASALPLTDKSQVVKIASEFIAILTIAEKKLTAIALDYREIDHRPRITEIEKYRAIDKLIKGVAPFLKGLGELCYTALLGDDGGINSGIYNAMKKVEAEIA